MNSMQIKDKIKNIAEKKNVDFNTVFRLYMYDRFVERLSVSEYRDNFILKGGFYLSTLFGVENRMTMDIDASITQTTFTGDNVKDMLLKIINIDIKDNAKLKLGNISKIREADEYGGYRAVIKVKIENVREMFSIDITIGDPITPKAIVYKYIPTLSDEYIKLWAYNIETILAEKLETILTRGEASSRTKDYYDIYLIYTKDWDNINKKHFTKAVEKTFTKREFNINILESFEIIRKSEILRIRWNNYSKKNRYAQNISFEDTINCLEEIIKVLQPVMV